MHEHYMNLLMDSQDNPQMTHPIHAGWDIMIGLYLNQQFGSIGNPDRQYGGGSVPTRTRSQSDGPELLLSLPLTLYSTLATLVLSNEHLMSTSQSLTTIENLKCNAMPSSFRNQSLQMLLQSKCQLFKSACGPRMPVMQSANVQQKPWGFGRRRVAWQHNGKIIKRVMAPGTLPSPWGSGTRNVTAPSNGIF